MHDGQYWLAQMAKTKKEQAKLVRLADERMIKSLKYIKKHKLDDPFNISVGLRLIQSKLAGEDLNALESGSFGGDLVKHPKDDVKFVKQRISELEKEGY